MSLSSSLHAALSGLSASAQWAETTASNVSNALTEGYGARQVQLVSRGVGNQVGGVRVVGIERNVNPVILRDRRLAQAESGAAGIHAEFARRTETAIGTPEKPGSLNAAITAFERSLVDASARPEATVRLQAVVNSANALG